MNCDVACQRHVALICMGSIAVISLLSYQFVYKPYLHDFLAVRILRWIIASSVLFFLFFVAILASPDSEIHQIVLYHVFLSVAYIGCVFPIHEEVVLIEEPEFRISRFIYRLFKGFTLLYVLIIPGIDLAYGIRHGGVDPCLLYLHIPIAAGYVNYLQSMCEAGPFPRNVAVFTTAAHAVSLGLVLVGSAETEDQASFKCESFNSSLVMWQASRTALGFTILIFSNPSVAWVLSIRAPEGHPAARNPF